MKNIVLGFLDQLRQLIGAIMTALGMYRWANTPEGKALLVSIK